MAELLGILLVFVLGLGVVLGLAVAVAILGSILRGWVLSILWGWFMVPTFGLPELGVLPAVGMMFTITFLFQYTKISSDVSSLKKKSLSGAESSDALDANLSVTDRAFRKYEKEKQERKEIKLKLVSLLLTLFAGPFFSLFFGWIIHKLM